MIESNKQDADTTDVCGESSEYIPSHNQAALHTIYNCTQRAANIAINTHRSLKIDTILPEIMHVVSDDYLVGYDYMSIRRVILSQPRIDKASHAHLPVRGLGKHSSAALRLVRNRAPRTLSHETKRRPYGRGAAATPSESAFLSISLGHRRHEREMDRTKEVLSASWHRRVATRDVFRVRG